MFLEFFKKLIVLDLVASIINVFANKNHFLGFDLYYQKFF